MADRYGIAFNASNPAETAQKLRNAGHQVADPGKSNHESGMAIDVYGSSKLDAVTPSQEKILNANGWYSAGIP
jgi:LAS superfamily LD-carboxypeptidase LdcB